MLTDPTHTTNLVVNPANSNSSLCNRHQNTQAVRKHDAIQYPPPTLPQGNSASGYHAPASNTHPSPATPIPGSLVCFASTAHRVGAEL